MKKVLVIDVEPEVQQLLSKVLVRAGHQVKAAATGEEGLKLLGEFCADLIIVDKNLPGMHGAEVIREARRLLPSVAVILITAFPEPFSLGPDRLNGYLGKPFKSLKVVEEAVAQALEAGAELQRRDEHKGRLASVVAGLTPGAKRRT